MSSNRVFRSVLFAAGAVLLTACASQTVAPNGTLDDKYFEKEAQNYEKFQHEGQTVYCSTPETRGAAIIPYIGHVRCISEPDLRLAVRDWRRDRVPAVRPAPAGAGQGGIGGG
jgi:hypothetical protein